VDGATDRATSADAARSFVRVRASNPLCFERRDDFLAKLQRIKPASISLRFIRRWWVELSIA
jgi:hypothetical protein